MVILLVWCVGTYVETENVIEDNKIYNPVRICLWVGQVDDGGQVPDIWWNEDTNDSFNRN